MSIDANTLTNSFEHIYTYVDPDGSNVHIHAGRLREWCLKHKRKLKVWHVPVSQSLAQKFIRENTVAPARIKRLTAKHMEEPILFCKDGTFTENRPDVFLVDGHHRYVWYALAGLEFGQAWILEEAEWQEFKIVGLPPITQDILKRMPILKRNY